MTRARWSLRRRTVAALSAAGALCSLAPALSPAQPAKAAAPIATVNPATAPAAKPSPASEGHVAAPSMLGATGLLRVVSADGAQKRALHVGVAFEAFHQRELFAFDPPDSHTHVGMRLALAYAPTSFLETFLVLSGRWDQNGRAGVDQTRGVIGDTLLGVKGCGWVSATVCVGGLGAVQLLAPATDAPFDVRSTSFHVRALATYDGTRAASALPLRLHGNIGVVVDNSDTLLKPTFDGATRFSLRVAEAHRLLFGLGAELRISPRVAPFAEWSLEVPLGLPERPGAPGFSSYPHVVTLGARLFPWRALAVTLAADFAITYNGRLGVPGTPPWQAHLGLAYGFGATPTPPPRPAKKPDDDF